MWPAYLACVHTLQESLQDMDLRNSVLILFYAAASAGGSTHDSAWGHCWDEQQRVCHWACVLIGGERIVFPERFHSNKLLMHPFQRIGSPCMAEGGQCFQSGSNPEIFINLGHLQGPRRMPRMIAMILMQLLSEWPK